MVSDSKARIDEFNRREISYANIIYNDFIYDLLIETVAFHLFRS